MARSVETAFERRVMKQIQEKLPDAYVGKITFQQGIPDRLILLGSRWATLEFKREKNAVHQPNQDWHVANMNSMSFSRFICPENKKQVLQELFDFLTK